MSGLTRSVSLPNLSTANRGAGAGAGAKGADAGAGAKGVEEGAGGAAAKPKPSLKEKATDFYQNNKTAIKATGIVGAAATVALLLTGLIALPKEMLDKLADTLFSWLPEEYRTSALALSSFSCCCCCVFCAVFLAITMMNN